MLAGKGNAPTAAGLGRYRPGPDRNRIWNQLADFYTHCADSEIAQLRRLAWTVNAWQPSIIEGLKTGISNGRTQEDRPRHWGGIVFTRIVETSHDLSLL